MFSRNNIFDTKPFKFYYFSSINCATNVQTPTDAIMPKISCQIVCLIEKLYEIIEQNRKLKLKKNEKIYIFN